jgi:hypothetical protein
MNECYSGPTKGSAHVQVSFQILAPEPLDEVNRQQSAHQPVPISCHAPVAVVTNLLQRNRHRAKPYPCSEGRYISCKLQARAGASPSEPVGRHTPVGASTLVVERLEWRTCEQIHVTIRKN